MRATNWEFSNRALVFGLIFGLAFPLYAIDQQNSTAALANRLGSSMGANPDRTARVLFGCAALLLVVAAFTRTWASSYLHANVVYAAEVKTASLVADGPYRHVRNPLYFANVLMAVGMGAMMSRTGFLVAVAAMTIFSYRLILREEIELQASQGDTYVRYCNAVPRLWPSPWPRVTPSGRQARWSEGFHAEFWCWGLAAGVATFALSLSLEMFFAIVAGSIGLFWVSSAVLQKKRSE